MYFCDFIELNLIKVKRMGGGGELPPCLSPWMKPCRYKVFKLILYLLVVHLSELSIIYYYNSNKHAMYYMTLYLYCYI